jgi:cell division transport system permease protein
MRRLTAISALLAGNSGADRVVPRRGATARLVVFTSAAMAFLAVFALALSLAAGRLAARWDSELAAEATVRISAPADQIDAQTKAVVSVLTTTPGVARAEVMAAEETARLLEPFLGPEVPVDALPLPRLVTVTLDGATRLDAEGLRLRLSAEAPGALYDDHTRWRAPLVDAAGRLRALGFAALALIGLATAAMITLAAHASLAANAQVIRVLRLVGARDAYVARAFVRRYTLRTLTGAAVGTLAGTLTLAVMPAAGDGAAFLSGLGFTGAAWILPAVIPLLAAGVAFLATRAAAFRTLRDVQ